MSQEQFSSHRLGLYTDYYELLMAEGYLLSGRQDVQVAFDYFIRKNPFGGGYLVFAGLQDLLAILSELRFVQDDLDYLATLSFGEEFLHALSRFRFRGTIRSCREGEVVFPLEPIVTVEGAMLEVQLIETLLLNTLNFQSLIATKASRVRLAAGGRAVAEFGLRRAHGFGGIQATRAALVGGLDSTSNVLGGRLYGLPVSGTQAHSWVQSFDSELEAFREYVRCFPGQCTLLVDTYDTVRSGVPNAITVAREMEGRQQRLAAVRLDSGDLAYLSKKARRMLDEAALPYVKIVASNKLDERIIKSLIDQGAPIDAFGVGTALVTGHPDAALDGVYKLAMAGGKPRMKVSDNPEKSSMPGLKRVMRCLNESGTFMADGIALAGEARLQRIHHPFNFQAGTDVGMCVQEDLHVTAMENGSAVLPEQRVGEIAAYARERLARLPEEHLRFDYPHIYRVGLSAQLWELRSQLLEQAQ